LDGIKSHNWEANLRWGTRIQNMQDKNLHGTSPQGERHGGAKLTEREVRLIRRLRRAGIKQNLIATRFGVSKMTISRVANGILWRHING
jgi:DNA invertase Pin-like site-specific DNA recombinase